MTDAFNEQPPAELPPLELAPMRPLDGPPAPLTENRWVYQAEVPGERVVVHVNGALSTVGILPPVRIVNSDAQDLSDRFPEFAALAELSTAGPFSIDGIIASFGSVTDIPFRLAATDPDDAAIRAAAKPVRLVIRDLIHIDGRRVGDLPYSTRRSLLTDRITSGPNWLIPTDHVDPADALVEDEEIPFPVPHLLSRRVDGRYFPGVASRAWLRTAYSVLRQAPIVGWLDQRAEGEAQVDALLVAGPQLPDGNRSVQEVRAGLTFARHIELAEILAQLPTSRAPKGLYYEPVDVHAINQVRWARPGTFATIIGTGFADDGTLRDPILLDSREQS